MQNQSSVSSDLIASLWLVGVVFRLLSWNGKNLSLNIWRIIFWAIWKYVLQNVQSYARCQRRSLGKVGCCSSPVERKLFSSWSCAWFSNETDENLIICWTWFSNRTDENLIITPGFEWAGKLEVWRAISENRIILNFMQGTFHIFEKKHPYSFEFWKRNISR